MVTNTTPLEDEEQEAFVEWLQRRNIPHFRVPNETFTKSWKQKAKNKRLGVKRGVPDLFVFVSGRTVAIEMKRRSGGRLSVDQKYWLDVIAEHGGLSYVCKGAQEAIKVVEGIIRGDYS